MANGYYIRADSDLFKAAETIYSASRDSLGSKDSKLVIGLNNRRNYSFLFHCKTELKYQKQKAVIEVIALSITHCIFHVVYSPVIDKGQL